MESPADAHALTHWTVLGFLQPLLDSVICCKDSACSQDPENYFQESSPSRVPYHGMSFARVGL